MANSINTNISAYSAQANIAKASAAATTSVSRLSSGTFITKASDDVARLSIGTSFATTVKTLRQALINASQGVSLLQVADGALGQITEILQRQKTLAVQASSGNLSNTDRSFLNQEFQALSDQIDFIATTSSFNGVNLLDGALANAASLTDAGTAASAGEMTMSFGDTIAVSDTVIINGVTFTAIASSGTPAGKQFKIGATLQESVQNLAERLNTLATDQSLVGVSSYTEANKLAISQAKYEAVGNTLQISSRTGGKLSDSFSVSAAGTATADYSSSLSGSYGGASFNLFAVTTGWTSATTVVSAAVGVAATPFHSNGDSITATVGGISHTLLTMSSTGGTGASSQYTLEDIVNGINANTGATGFRASLVYNGSTYNIRLDYSGKESTVLMNLGSNYESSTYHLAGEVIDTSATSGVATGYVVTGTLGGADQRRSIFASGAFDLLDANTYSAALTATSTTAAATAPSTVGAPFQTGESLVLTINGKAYTLHTFGASDGLDDIIAGVNAGSATHGVVAAAVGTLGSAANLRLYLTDPSGGTISVTAGASFYATLNALNTDTAVTAPTSAISKTNHYGLDGGANDGLGLGNTSVSGTVSDSILTDLNTTKTNLRANFTQNASAGESIVVGDTTFYFTSTTTNAAPNEILIGANLKETLDNLVSTINSYAVNFAVGTAAHELNQLDIKRDGESVTFTSKRQENVTDLSGSASTVVVSGVSGVSINNSGNLNNAATAFGVKVDGITNPDFIGTIQGFEATYTGTADQVDLSVTVGDYTYTADNVDTTSTSAQTVRFFSENGGYFDIRLAANEVLAFSDQAGADAVADRLNAAFSGLTFSQTRNITSYNGTSGFSVNGAVTGSLYGSSFAAKLSDFTDLKIGDITIAAPQGNAADATISFTVGGKTFTSLSGITDQLGANQTYRFVNAEDPDNEFIEFTTGDTIIQLDTDAKALAFQNALEEAFGATAEAGGGALSFQIGTSAEEALSVSIGRADTDELFSGVTLSIATLEDAATASDAIDTALSAVTSIRASVGALQSRFNFASANIQISVQNQDASRSELLDTDIAQESTSYATSQVQLQAGISVLAQANQQLQNLLKLLG